MRRALLALLVLAAVGLWARGAVPCELSSVQPACRAEFLPGPAIDALDAVELGDGVRAYSSTGQLVFTTVRVDTELTLREWVRGLTDPTVELVDRRLVVPPDVDSDDVAERNAERMTESQAVAVLAALRHLGFEATTDEARDGELPIDVAIDAGEVGGPSAGLMFALAVVDRLTPDDLTGGTVVAGTGSIDAGGRVGEIGGIRQKVSGAIDREDGGPPATVFLTPAGQVAEARAAAVDSEILLVPVETLADGLEALRDLARGSTPAGALAIGAD